MNPWEWITTTTTVDNVLTTLGVATLAILFARDLIITRGSHLRRIADLTTAYEARIAEIEAHHAREREADAAHVERVDESRVEWRTAAGLERERADKATATMSEVADAQRGLLHVLETLLQAVREMTKQ